MNEFKNCKKYNRSIEHKVTVLQQRFNQDLKLNISRTMFTVFPKKKILKI